MAFSKSSLYPKNTQTLSAFARALSHPERLQIMRFLSDRPYSSVRDISARSPLTYSRVSQHLQSLRKSGLVLITQEPPHTLYSLDEQMVAAALRSIGEVREVLSGPGG